ncbi:MAG: hypothetical protein EVJ46_09810 [Candidatus Acididesulfobacter guangdongensis]|uniref:Uncharacterized protein n=1 Tax=Acididesulfobacter guangdongensis TaxID=2597225 RepID=A0A519BEW6_ACIG2|nr:MAG: hypothetical protein EVJ46_09810 [Candidatus Acididesulfobacter guangdongensis]
MPLIFSIDAVFSKFFNFNKLIPCSSLIKQSYSNTGADAIIYKSFHVNLFSLSILEILYKYEAPYKLKIKRINYCANLICLP